MKINTYNKENVSFIEINNNSKMEVCLCTFGASFYELKTPNKEGKVESIILTPTNLEDFYYSNGYYGKSVGRFSGRIDKAKCTINGVEYVLEKNWNGVNSLHGGYKGISFQNFDYCIEENNEYIDVIFSYLEKEDLLPGDVNYKITYRIFENENKIRVIFNATTNKETIVNLTNHVYFNLSGNLKYNCLTQYLQFFCDKYTKLNNELITESIDPVNKIFDFRNKHRLGEYIFDKSLQKHKAFGYDHCWLKEDVNNPLIAILEDDVSGRKVSVSTSYPSIVSYVGCYPSQFLFNKEGLRICQYHSVCLECQYIPNGINMDNVDKALLKEGEEYSHYIEYLFE